MTTVYVREQGATVRRRGERLVVTKGQKELLDVPFMHVEQVAVVGNVQLTTQAVAALLEREVDVVFFSSAFRFRGRLLTTGSKFAELRRAQLEAMQDDAVALGLAREMVAGKLANQRMLLQRRLRRVTDPGGRPAMEAGVAGIQRMIDAARKAPSLDVLRGYEGKAGAWYFGGLKSLIDPAWGFAGRAYYPPPDPVNAALSFGYGLLLRDATAAVQLVGLDPYLGIFHAIHYGRPSMALDVMEEFRPLVVDGLMLGLLETGRLASADFVKTGKSARPIELAAGAVDVVLRAYEERMAATIMHPASGQRVSYRRALELQVRQVAAVVLNKSGKYAPMTGR